MALLTLRWLASQGFGLLITHWPYAIAYVMVASLISFAVMYRTGPAHDRTLNLIKWGMQLLSLVLIYLSCYQCPPVPLTIIFSLLIIYCLGKRL